MKFIYYLWDKFLVNDIFKWKKYEENSVYFEDRDIKTLAFFSLSQLYQSYLGRKSFRNDDLIKKYRYSYESAFKKIDATDVVSFDIFDTLIFRAVSRPTDSFFFVEKEMGIQDFKRIRIQAERTLGSNNTFADDSQIYDVIKDMIGIFSHIDMEFEKNVEFNICFANEAILPIYNYAKENGKKIICVSDMHHSSDFLKQLLMKNGFEIDDIYVSCEQHGSKKIGNLQIIVSDKYKGKKILHIGDNKKLDVINSTKAGFDTFYIRNHNSLGHKYRAYIDYNFEGSVYSGLINSKINTGLLDSKSIYYKLGYIYSGVLSVGFSDWLYDLAINSNSDNVFLMGRDCKVIKDVFDSRHSDLNSTYFESSRTSLYPLVASVSYDFFLEEAFSARLFDNNYDIETTFASVGLNYHEDMFENSFFNGKSHVSRNSWLSFKQTMYGLREKILLQYEPKVKAIENYICEKIGNSKKILFVDLGWKGSSIIFLKKYIESKFEDIHVTGAMLGASDVYLNQNIIAGNDLKCFAFSPFEINGNLVNGSFSVLSSTQIFFLEHIFTSNENAVVGYKIEKGKAIILRENCGVQKEYLSDVHQGINDFAADLNMKLGDYSSGFRFGAYISFLPMCSILKRKKFIKYLKKYIEEDSIIHNVC